MMRVRCNNESNKSYKNYGGRGIIVCDEWNDKGGYKRFREWAYDNGYDENAPYGKCTLDRIDVNGNYCPENCRWVDAKTQGYNKRTSTFIEFNGKSLTICQWAEYLGINQSILQKRRKLGWSVSEMLTTPINGSDLESKIGKRVICVETGEIFASINSASKWAGVSSSTIQHALRCTKYVAGGYHWIRKSTLSSQEISALRDSIIDASIHRSREITNRKESASSNKGVRDPSIYDYHRKRVRCIETKQEFASVKDAARVASVNPTNMSACCRGKLKTLHGLHYEYIE